MNKTILCTLLFLVGSFGAFAHSTDTLFKSSVQEIMLLKSLYPQEEQTSLSMLET